MNKKFPDYKRGDKQIATEINTRWGFVERLGRFAFGADFEVEDGPTGPHVALKKGFLPRLAKSPTGGIAALSGTTPGSGTCRLWHWNGTALVDSQLDVTAYNLTLGVVPASTYITLDKIDGVYVVRLDTPPARLALTGSSIGARSGTTMGSGTVTLQNVSGTTISSAGTTVTAYNMSATAIGSAKYIQIKMIGGQWLVDTESCP